MPCSRRRQTTTHLRPASRQPTVPMPHRPREHELEDESRKAFENLLPARLIYRPITPDYGIDGEVEEFESGTATGRRFFVQLKATDEQDLTKALRVRVRLATAAYYRAQPSPVLMVRYMASRNAVFARWFHEFDPYNEHVGDTHLTFHWSEGDLLNADGVDQVLAEAARIRTLRSVDFHPPVTIAFSVPAGIAHGYAKSELELAFESVLSQLSTVVTSGASENDAHITAAVADEELVASVSGIASVTLHLEDGYGPDVSDEQVINDLLSCVALALARAGHGGIASRLAVVVFAGSLLAAVPPFASELAEAMLQAGHVGDVLELAEKLDQCEDESQVASGYVFIASVLRRSDSLRVREHADLLSSLTRRLERRLERGDDAAAAAAAENLGRQSRQMGEHADAADYFEQAVDLDPDRLTADIAQEIAGALFLGQKYDSAVAAYDRAIELVRDRDPDLEARRADALLYAGRYREAFDAFAAIDPATEETKAWIYCKQRALSAVMETTGIERQERQPEAATELAGQVVSENVGEHDEIAGRTWGLDAVSSLGWFNQARTLLDRGSTEAAMLAYLTAAVMNEGDVEAWVNVALLAMQTESYDLLAASAITGQRLNDNSYMGEFARQVRGQVDDPADREELIAAVREALDTARRVDD
jgi:tetratricopeptide (TPR) repeat protein